jgi:hypothetical protein
LLDSGTWTDGLSVKRFFEGRSTDDYGGLVNLVILIMWIVVLMVLLVLLILTIIKMNITSQKCLNFNANTDIICKLIASHDICFFIEHWLREKESFRFNEICSNHSILFSAEYNCANRLVFWWSLLGHS